MKRLPKINTQLLGPTLLVVAQYVTQIIGPLVSLLVVRYLGPEQFGLYASAMAITALLSVLPDFGLQQAALNLNARREWPMAGILRRSLGVGMLYAAVTYALVTLWMESVDYHLTVRNLALMMGLMFFRMAVATVLTTGLQVEGKYGRIAFWNFLIGCSQWGATLAAILIEADVYWLVLAPILVSLTASTLMLLIEGSRLSLFRRGRRPLAASRVPVRPLLIGSWRFGLASAMHQLYYKSDVAVLSVFRPAAEVGQYTVAFRLIELFFLFPGVVFNQVLYPKYVVWCRENLPKLRLYYGIMNKVMVAAGVAVTVVLILFGEELVRILFGEEQANAASFLSILAIGVPLRFWVSSAGAVLTNDRLIAVKLKIQMGAAVLNTALNLIWIPKYGGMAAAVSMIATHVVLLAAYSYAAHRYMLGFGKLKPDAWKPLLMMSAAAAIGLSAFQPAELILKIVDCLLLFAVVIASSVRWFQQNERAELRSLIGRRETRAERLGTSA